MDTDDRIIGPINIGNENEFTILELASLVIELVNSRSKIRYLPLPDNDPAQRKPDTTYARELLNWQAEIQLSEGLLKTIKYFEDLLQLGKQ